MEAGIAILTVIMGSGVAVWVAQDLFFKWRKRHKRIARRLQGRPPDSKKRGQG